MIRYGTRRTPARLPRLGTIVQLSLPLNFLIFDLIADSMAVDSVAIIIVSTNQNEGSMDVSISMYLLRMLSPAWMSSMNDNSDIMKPETKPTTIFAMPCLLP